MSAFLNRYDFFLWGAVLVLVLFGLLTLYSISEDFFFQQLIWFLIAAFIAVLVSLMDLRPLVANHWFVLGLYLGSVALLILTAFFAPSIRGTQSWLTLGPIQFQTSEFAKVALILLLAYFFARAHVSIARIGNIAKSFLYFVIPGILVFRQPDLGSAIVLFAIWVGFLLVSGIKWRHLVIGLALLLIFTFLGWHFVFEDYQKDRVIAFLNPAYDPLGINYSVIQSEIAIGSAGWFGKGFGQGTQVQLGFLPESHSDFIFSAFVEEWGLLAGFFLLLVFFFLLFRIARIGLRSESNFFRFVCLGAVMMFGVQFLLNVGSALGFLPVTGVTLPLFSYGGSSLLMSMVLIGIVQGIAFRTTFLRA